MLRRADFAPDWEAKQCVGDQAGHAQGTDSFGVLFPKDCIFLSVITEKSRRAIFFFFRLGDVINVCNRERQTQTEGRYET